MSSAMTDEAKAVRDMLEQADRIERKASQLRILVGDRRVCKECNGGGKIRYWHAQDETELIKCEKCGGRGVVVKP